MSLYGAPDTLPRIGDTRYPSVSLNDPPPGLAPAAHLLKLKRCRSIRPWLKDDMQILAAFHILLRILPQDPPLHFPVTSRNRWSLLAKYVRARPSYTWAFRATCRGLRPG